MRTNRKKLVFNLKMIRTRGHSEAFLIPKLTVLNIIQAILRKRMDSIILKDMVDDFFVFVLF